MNVAVVTPPDVPIVPDPEAAGTAAVVQVAFEYRVKLTEPVGAAAPVAEKVAVSDRLAIVVPAVPVDGEATVEIVGDALPTEICSFESPQVVVNPLLLASPAYEAIQ